MIRVFVTTLAVPSESDTPHQVVRSACEALPMSLHLAFKHKPLAGCFERKARVSYAVQAKAPAFTTCAGPAASACKHVHRDRLLDLLAGS